jgi:hypothetical protein
MNIKTTAPSAIKSSIASLVKGFSLQEKNPIECPATMSRIANALRLLTWDKYMAGHRTNKLVRGETMPLTGRIAVSYSLKLVDLANSDKLQCLSPASRCNGIRAACCSAGTDVRSLENVAVRRQENRTFHFSADVHAVRHSEGSAALKMGQETRKAPLHSATDKSARSRAAVYGNGVLRKDASGPTLAGNTAPACKSLFCRPWHHEKGHHQLRFFFL